MREEPTRRLWANSAQVGVLKTRGAAARTKSEREWIWEGRKDCTILKGGGRLGSASSRPGRAWPGEAERMEAGLQQASRISEPRSYRSARVRSQVLEVGAVDGLQGLQLVVLPLGVAVRRLVPAAAGSPTTPSHCNAGATAGRPRSGGGGPGRASERGPLCGAARGQGPTLWAGLCGPWAGRGRGAV